MSSRLRPMPTETVKGLTPPLPGFPYFGGADKYRFQPRLGEVSPVNAWWLADASFLVYGDADFIEQTLETTPLPDLGYELDWIGTRDDNRGMVLSNEEAMMVVFRGTRLHQHSILDAAEVVMIDQDDLWTDSQFLPTASEVGGMVHQGFLSGFSEISDTLDSLIAGRSDSQSLWFTGHSLGAHWLPSRQPISATTRFKVSTPMEHHGLAIGNSQKYCQQVYNTVLFIVTTGCRRYRRN